MCAESNLDNPHVALTLSGSRDVNKAGNKKWNYLFEEFMPNILVLNNY